MPRKHLLGSFIALAAALAFASTALATSGASTGERKNEAPFTAAAHPYGIGLAGQAQSSIAGEAKNELPFTRLVTRSNPGPDWFERYAAAHPYGTGLTASATQVSTSAQGFHWRDALIGAAAAASLALLGATAVGVSRSRRRDSVAQAIRA